MLDKTYLPQEVEPRIYNAWETSGAFAAGREGLNDNAEPFCIVIPPPNVTGSLHMGHALNNTIQDILVRFWRMRGRDVLWQPGMDHAGIATQMVVERQLAENHEPSRSDMGREAFIERVWEWKEQSGGTIINQLKRLGASCDWSRERFTMDEGLSRAVLKVFVEMYRAGLIYKDKRLVNWDPKFQTAISDLEVQPIETNGHLWHLRYPLKDGKAYNFPITFDEHGTAIEWEERDYIVVATTRPETMLGDTAVAVHPGDERYKKIVGKTVILPLVGREIKIIADDYVDAKQGSGAVKITPAHDFNDFEVGRRHSLEMINVLDHEAHLLSNDLVPDALRGLDRYEARELIIEELERMGLVEVIENHNHMVPYGDRSNVVIEPYLTDQWYVDAATLAKPAIAAVEAGETKFIPKNWEKTYFEWMRNIQPWCISRQLWWGHQIPAWYGPDQQIFVAQSEDEAHALASENYGRSVELIRDSDVLDTWFSSGLWPFSTLGWPDDTAELKKFYKTDVLVTAFDIIFFWIARMMMMGLQFMNDENGKPEVPFHTVYIHALVRDEKGQKMSKSKGNVIDPLGLIDQYGADALRFTLAAMAAQGRDVKLATNRVEGYRNFATKLWNVARFTEMNGCARKPGFDPANVDQTVNRWIVGEVASAARDVTAAIESYRFNEAAGAIYHFLWHVYCDWYVELIKPTLAREDVVGDETRATASWALDEALKLLHPFMPFITEELWGRLGAGGPVRESMLITASWPECQDAHDGAADDEMNWVIDLINEIRSVRSEMNVPASVRVPIIVQRASQNTKVRLERHGEIISHLSRAREISAQSYVPEGSVQFLHREATIALPLSDIIDLTAEHARLTREIVKIDGEIAKIDDKLGNQKFMEKAPEHVVETQRERRADEVSQRDRLQAVLERLPVN
jgi:valyl-tRNA synthetase